jgi:O-antigen/teichoic acid export membrane protein
MKLAYQRLIAKISTLLKTDIHYLLQGSFWLVISQGVATVSSLVLALAFAHLLTKEAYGEYKYILSWAGVIASLSLSGLRTAITQSASHGHEGVLKRSFYINLRWSIILIVVSLVFALYYYINSHFVFAVSFLFLGACTPFMNSASLYGSFLNGQKKFSAIAFYSNIRNVLPALLLLGTLFITKNILTLIIVYFITNTLALLYCYYDTVKKHVTNAKDDPEFEHFGKHLSIISLVKTFANKVDSIFIFHFLGAAPLAVYSYATAIPEQLMSLLANIYILAVPRFAAHENAHTLRKAIIQKSRLVAFFSFPIALIYALIAPYLYRTLFPQYVDSIYYSQLFAVIIALATVNLVIGAYQDSRKTINDKYVSSFGAAIPRIILMLVLVKPYGLTGIIGAEIIARILYFSLSLIMLKREHAREKVFN